MTILKPTTITRILSTMVPAVMLLSMALNADAAPPGQGGDGLFTDAAIVESSGNLPAGPTIIRTRLVEPNFDLLGGAYDSRAADVLVLNLFDDVTFTAVLDRAESNPSGSLSWIGQLVDVEYGSVVLVVKDEVMVGSVVMPGAFYRVSYVGDGVHAISEMNSEAFPPELEPIPVTPSDEDLAEALIAPMADDGSTIDVLVVYTPAARLSVGGTTAMENLIDVAVFETNLSYASSDITQRLILLAAAEVGYDESIVSWSKTLSLLKGTSDGHMDIVHAWRDHFRADEVVLIVDRADVCGIAYVMNSVSTAFASSAFAVVSQNCATGYYSFGHELGHNMAARHDWYVDTSTSPYTYLHGYVNPTDRWRTIMAYNDECEDNKGVVYCTRLRFWSNPNLLYGGDPMGVPKGTSTSCRALDPKPNCDADNHRVLNNTAYTVANFRVSRAPTGICVPDRNLYCGRMDGWNNSHPGSTHQIDSYPCSPWEESGPEYAYNFVPNVSGLVTVRLDAPPGDLDIFVLDGEGEVCDAVNCIAMGYAEATFRAQAGHTYFLVVDGYGGAVRDYTIDVQCSELTFLPFVIKN